MDEHHRSCAPRLSNSANLCLYVHHADAVREFSHDRDASIGRLDEARERDWTLVDMRRDWKSIYPAP